MFMFWLSALGLIAIMLLITLPVFWGRYQQSSVSRRQQNIELARLKLQELEQFRNEGVLTDDSYQQQRQEIERALLYDTEDNNEQEQIWSGAAGVSKAGDLTNVLALALFVPLFSLTLYFALGSPASLFQRSHADDNIGQVSLLPGHPSSAAGDIAPHSLDEMVTRLEKKLAQSKLTVPENAESWKMLGRSYMTMGRYLDAARVYNRINRKLGASVESLLAEADALAMVANGAFRGRPEELINMALRREPENSKGLWLAGMLEKQKGNAEKAVEYWRHAKQLLNDDSESVKELDMLINAALSSVVSVDKTLSPFKGIKVKVTVLPGLVKNIPAGSSVFIFAKAVNGPGMPLAVVRRQLSDLPTAVILSDEQAMMKGMEISRFEKVSLSARISVSGKTMAQKGDYISPSLVIFPGRDAETVLQIDRVIQ